MQEQRTIDKGGIIQYFLNPEKCCDARSIEALAKNLDDFLSLRQLTSKELALVLFHATKGAQMGLYSEDTTAACEAIKNRVQTWTDKAIKRNDYSGYTIAHMFDAFSRLDLRPPERFVSFALEKAKTLIASNFNADDMTDFTAAIAHLAILPDKKLLTAIGTQLTQVKRAFSPHQTCSVIRSVAILDTLAAHHHGSKRYSFGSTFSEFINDNKIREKLANLSDPASKGMLSDALLWFKGTTPYPRSAESGTSSLFENDNKIALENAGATVQMGVHIPTPNHIIDLSATFGRATFYVECDGPSHFIHGADDHKIYLNGPTIFQTALISKGYPDTTLVRIPADVFYPKRGDSDFWESFLITVDDADNGAYCLASGGNLLPIGEGRDRAFQYT